LHICGESKMGLLKLGWGHLLETLIHQQHY
jgi:hypothetical protein